MCLQESGELPAAIRGPGPSGTAAESNRSRARVQGEVRLADGVAARLLEGEQWYASQTSSSNDLAGARGRAAVHLLALCLRQPVVPKGGLGGPQRG